MKRKHFSAGTLTAPLPPAMVTVGDFDNANILTVAWTGILSTHPARTYVSIRPSRHSHQILRESGEFVINLASADMARTVDYVGIYSGKKVDKFKKCGLTRERSEKVAPPTIAECPIALECRVCDVISMGTHDVFIADIVSVSCRENLLDEEGKMHYEWANLLAYAHGEYYALGEKIGRFGFSTDKTPKEENKNGTSKREKTEGKSPKSAEASPKSAKTGAKSAEASPKSSKTGAKSAEASPKSSKTGAKSAEAGPQSSKTGAKSAKSSAKLAKTSLKNAEAGGSGATDGSASKDEFLPTEKKRNGSAVKSANTESWATKNEGFGFGEDENKKPFYAGLPKGKRKKSAKSDKGAPHRKGGVRK